MNKIANPLVKLILLSPFHGLMSASVLILTYRGCRSGKEYMLPVQYVQDGNNLFIVPGDAEKKTWWRNFKDGLDVLLRLKGQFLSGCGILIEYEANAEEIIKGLGLYFQRFPLSAKIYKVRIGLDGQPNPADLLDAAKTIKMIRVKLNDWENHKIAIG